MNNSYKDIYRDIRTQSKISFQKGMLAGHFLTRDIGRLCSAWFIRHGVIPNQITLLMIIFGVIGSILFAIPNVWCKISGYICWLMWFSMDCSDGQVARYTKKFSKYGTEMDYMAHLIDHPCMNLALWATFIQMNIFNETFLSLLFMVSISLELVFRNTTAFYHYNKDDQSNGESNTQKSYFKYIIQELFLYPTYIICISWTVILGYYFNSPVALYIYVLWFIIYSIGVIRRIYAMLIKFYNQ